MLLRIEIRADNEGQVSVIVLLPIAGNAVFLPMQSGGIRMRKE